MRIGYVLIFEWVISVILRLQVWYQLFHVLMSQCPFKIINNMCMIESRGRSEEIW